jgi:hypothetical protein
MNIRPLAIRLATAAALATLASGAFAQESQRVAVKTAGLPTFVAHAIEEKAAQGIGPLRAYVERTRMIHGLYIPDLVREDAAAIEQAKAVPAEEAPVVAKRQQASPTKLAAAKTTKPQLAKNTKAASPVQVASAKQAGPAKVTTAKNAAVTDKLALAGQKTKRA